MIHGSERRLIARERIESADTGGAATRRRESGGGDVGDDRPRGARPSSRVRRGPSTTQIVMISSVDNVLSELVNPDYEQLPLAVRSPIGTRHPDNHFTQDSEAATDFVEYNKRVDALFNDTPAYHAVKSEKPVHRMMLWHAIKGFNCAESANMLGYHPTWVGTVRKQPWFRKAFCEISTSLGKDAYMTYLQGEVLPAIQRTVELANSAENEATKLAANREILDRFLGKSTVKVESKSTSTVDIVVTEIAKLQEESRLLDERLKANGTYSHSPS